MGLYAKALAFAVKWHGEQKRKYTNEPYVNHPIRVANLLRYIDAPEFVIAAGLLHDVLEDTGVTAAEMEMEFGTLITNLVLEVTDVSRPEDGNRKTRKAMDRAHLANASFWGQTIKLADLIDNTSDIAAHDPDFATVYLREKEDLLAVMRIGHPDLYDRAAGVW